MSFNFDKAVPRLTFWLTAVVLACGIVWSSATAYGQAQSDHSKVEGLDLRVGRQDRNIVRICQKLDIPCENPKD